MAVNSFREDEYMENTDKEDFKPAAFLFVRL